MHRNSTIIFVSVNTPTKSRGFGGGSAANLKNVELAARSIAEYAEDAKIVVNFKISALNTTKNACLTNQPI